MNSETGGNLKSASEFRVTIFFTKFVKGCATSAVTDVLLKFGKHGKAVIVKLKGDNLPPALEKQLTKELSELFPFFLKYRERGVRAWGFVFEGVFIRTNVNVLGSISIALQRGVKEIPDVISYANHPSIITYTVEHIFRGHGANGGRHHISALIADNSRKLTGRLKETADGFYEAVIKRSDGKISTKSFWPDTWDENKIMDELKHIMANNPINILGTNNWEGLTTTGQLIRYYVKSSDNSIISAFPVL